MSDALASLMLRPGPQGYVERLIGRCQPLVAGGETVRLAWTAKKGLGANSLVLVSWFTQLLLVFQSFRVVAVTDQRVYVFKSGWFTRYKPKQLLRVLPRVGAIQGFRGRGTFQLGPERLQVDRPFLNVVVVAAQGSQANGMI